jgi:hypothetical protein
MLPDTHTCEKLALEHRHALLREAEQERMLAAAESPKHASHLLQCLAGRLGMYLIALGTSLKRFEQCGQAVEEHHVQLMKERS